MADKDRVQPPHELLQEHGLQDTKCQGAILKLLAEKEAAEERARGLNEIVLCAQLEPVEIQNEGIHIDRKGKGAKIYTVYTIYFPQSGKKEKRVHVRLTQCKE